MGADSTFSKGHLVDRYEIRELIGEGGMGAIYRAVDTRLGRTVALKVVRAARLGSSTGDQARQRFLRETLAISKVDHRNVVRVLDFGFSGDTPYLAMEYLRGQDLGKVIKASPELLPIAEVVDVMLGVCAAIRACHEAGIIHRDLKPSNIFLSETDSDRVVKILDFGVSKPPIASDLTRDGQIVGTPQYLAPEQIDGKAVPQTDQYAIGVMLYVCLTKVLPYQEHASFGLLRAIMMGNFPPPRGLRPDLPDKLEAIILRAMRTAPEERFESVHALGRELLEFASAEARVQWRSYYLDAAPRALPKASTHAMPLIEVMARGLAAEGPVRNTAALAPTETVADVAGAAAPLAAPTPPAPDPSKPTLTMEREVTGGGRARRRPMVASIVAAGVAALGLVGWWASKRPAATDSLHAVTPVAAPAAAPVQPVEPPPRRSPEQATAVAPPPPAPPPPGPAAAAGDSAPPEPPKRARRSHPRNNGSTPPEHTADGIQRPSVPVPIMP